MTAYAPIQVTATSAGQEFALPWPILSRNDVQASVNGSPVGITWINDALIQLPTAIGNPVVIQRNTQLINPAVTFKGGSVSSKDLNIQVNQLFFRAQELPFIVSGGIQIPGPPGPAGPAGPSGSGSGDVTGPATNTDNYVPQWNANNSKVLKNGRHIGVASGGDLLDRDAGDSRYPRAAYGTVQLTSVAGDGTGQVSLAGKHGQFCLLTTDGGDDSNIWNFPGMQLGEEVTLIPDGNYGLLFQDIDGSGQHLFGNYEGVARQASFGGGGNAAALPINQYDLIQVRCYSLSPYRVRVNLLENQFGPHRVLRPDAGSGQNPDSTLLYFGKLGKFTSTKGIPYGDFVMYTNGTVRKPIVGGLVLRGVGDSSSIFFENFAAEGQDEGDGLEDLRYAIPWDDYKRIGNRIAWAARIADGTGKLVQCTDIVAPGGPGSLNSGEYAVVQGYAQALPTSSSTPGGLAFQSTPAGVNTPIERMALSSTGAVVIFGQAAMEGFGTYAQAINGRLTDSNIEQWHIPSLDVAREYPHYADLQFYAVPLDSAKNVRGYASLSFRKYGKETGNHHPDGVDFGHHNASNVFYWWSADDNVRHPSYGTKNDRPGLILAGVTDAPADYIRKRGTIPLLTDDHAVTIPVDTNKCGFIKVATNINQSAIFGFSTYADHRGTEKLSGSGLFAAGSGTLTDGGGGDGVITVSAAAEGIYISNRAGGSLAFTVEITDG